MAATSILELEALLHGLPANDARFHEPDAWSGYTSRRGVVFLALPVRFCGSITLLTARSTATDQVTIDEGGPNLCANGAGTAAFPPMYLAAIPLTQLSAGVETFRLQGGFSEARVDLRPPVESELSATLSADAHTAVLAAQQRVGLPRIATVHELDVVRWHQAEPTCGALSVVGASLPVSGFIVVVDHGAGTPEPMDEEFRWADGTLVDCGPTTVA
jgi:hypothetical protein